MLQLHHETREVDHLNNKRIQVKCQPYGFFEWGWITEMLECPVFAFQTLPVLVEDIAVADAIPGAAEAAS